MADRVLRKKDRFNYKVFSEKGVKVPISDFSNSLLCGTINMSSEAKVTGELSGLLFEIEETLEDLQDVNSLSLEELRRNLAELKVLRVSVVKVSSELRILKGDNAEPTTVDTQLTDLLNSSKAMVGTLKAAIKGEQTSIDHQNLNLEQRKNDQDAAERRARKFAFDKMLTEISSLTGSLNEKYDIEHDQNISREVILMRKEMKSSYAAEFDRVKTLFDRILEYTDVQFEDKEMLLNAHLEEIAKLDESKVNFEEKLHNDLEKFDLTDQKMRLATLTKVDIGRFSGSLERGMDYYTFKSKFLKAYSNHPKSLLVEWLVNNHLEGRAKECVGSLEDLDEIWMRLKNNFGNTEQMLAHQFKKIHLMGSMHKQKGFESKKYYLQKLVNIMQDVHDLAVEYDLTGELHYGNHAQKVVTLLENYIQSKWYKIIAEEKLTKPHRWQRLHGLLTAELEIIQVRVSEMLEDSINTCDEKKDASGATKGGRAYHASEMCKLCDEKHPSSNGEFTQCRKFLLLSPKERCDMVRKKKCCLQCLDGKARWDSRHQCSETWICRNSFHDKYDKKLHFLLCEQHTSDNSNKELYEDFKSKILKDEWQKNLHSTIYITAHVSHSEGDYSSSEDLNPVDSGSPAYILQPYPFNGHTFSIMFDTGCHNFVCRSGAVDLLPETHKTNTMPGPIIISGVGCQQVTSQHGQYTVRLPTHNGKLATFNGICLDVITGAMPPYPVREARKSIVADYVSKGGKGSDLPDVPELAGGETDFLIGILYNYFQPRLVHILPTGLAIYKSIFAGINGTRGCIGGAHELFRQCERQFLETNNIAQFRVFLQRQLQLYNTGIKVCLDCTEFTLGHVDSSRVLQDGIVTGSSSMSSDTSFDEDNVVNLYNSASKHCKEIVIENGITKSELANIDSVIERNIVVADEQGIDNHKPLILLSSKVKLFQETEGVGSSIEYRCIKCRGCAECRNGEFVEKVSFKEEREQDLINSSVTVDFSKQITSALLPFICNPEEKLLPNWDIACKIYNQQVKKLSRDPVKKNGVIQSEQKLQDAGHVDWLSNLPEHQQESLNDGVSYYLPWRIVQNENSLSTPIRLVFDASSTTKSGYSLNDILAKGINSMNSLLEIFIRFRSYIVALHTDIRQMYNVIKLKPEHWKFQKYLWDLQLDPDKEPSEKVIKTIIYGVRSSGNQAECGLRRTAIKQKEVFPEAAESIIADTYADDCATGSDSTNTTQLSSDIIELLSAGGFTTKGFTITGEPPPSSLSKDGISVSVMGTRWYSEEDKIQLAVGKLNFSKKIRGKKCNDDSAWVVPDRLTKRICMGKVAEIFDLCGLIAPVMAGFKIDLHKIVVSSYAWDDPLSAADREIWLKNFQIMDTLGEGMWPRATFPKDCANLDVELIGCGDASQNIACAACYARVLKKDGTYSCQMVLAKTKVVPEDKSLPKAELLASTLNTHVTEIVKRALKRFPIKKCVYILDSEIVLHWLASEIKQLKPWTRNRVIEISRFTKIDQWYHISSNSNPADLGTRKGALMSDVNEGAEWSIGMRWMHEPLSDLIGSTLKDVNEIKLKNEHLAEVKKEHAKPTSDLCNSDFNLVIAESKSNSVSSAEQITMCHATASNTSDLVSTIEERLLFSNYIIDPNKFKFAKVVRVLAIVIKVSNLLLSKIGRRIHQFTKSLNEASNPIRDRLAADAPGLELSDLNIQNALNYFFRKATEELKRYVHPKFYEKESHEKDGIIYYTGRVSSCDISFQCDITEKMLDLSKDTFIVPIIDRHSPLAYAIVNQYHWEDNTVKHSGIETTIRAVMTVAHILKVRDLVKVIKRNCKRCRFILKRTVDVIMGPASKDQLCVAPPFYVSQVDICGPFKAYSVHNKRTTVKIYIATFVCCTTGTTSLKIMEGYDTVQFLYAFSRFACELGYPKKLLIDEGSQLVCGCENAVLNMVDIQGTLNREYGIEFRTCPVGGHNYNGKAERKIRTVQNVMNKSIHLARLSVLEWETLCSEISNSINNLPVAIGNETEELESLDLITPNRLRLGRNNQRSPVGPLEVTDKIDRLMRLKLDIFQSWWEAWLVSAVPKLMPKPKWFNNEKDVQKGDVIIFSKGEGDLSGEYKYGMIKDIHIGRDGKIRSVTIKYRNPSENVNRTTNRAVRSLVIIHRVDEIDLMEEIGSAAAYANGCYFMEFSAGAPGV